MPAELISHSQPLSRDQEPIVVSGELRCALTGKQLSPDEVYWAPPLITAQQLVATLARALVTTPGALGQVLLGEQPNVPYASEARAKLAASRSAEQLKLVALLLLLAALLIVPIVMLAA